MVDHLRDDPYIHKPRPDWYFRKHHHSKKLLQCHKHGGRCRKYSEWKRNHKERARKLKAIVDDMTICKFEDVKMSLYINGRLVQINGTIRSSKCSNLPSGRDQMFPFTCNECKKEMRYLKVKIRNRESAKYKKGERYGKRGVNYKIMAKEELVRGSKQQRTVLTRFRKQCFKPNISDVKERLIYSSETNDEQSFISDIVLLIRRGVFTRKPVHFKILQNMVRKLRRNRNHRYSDTILRISRMTRNRLGRHSYALFSVSMIKNF